MAPRLTLVKIYFPMNLELKKQFTYIHTIRVYFLTEPGQYFHLHRTNIHICIKGGSTGKGEDTVSRM